MSDTTGSMNFIQRRRYLRNQRREEFKKIIRPIMQNLRVQEMKRYNHHSQTNCLAHSLHVAYCNYVVCRKFGWDAEAGAKAGLLHDMFLYDWHTHKRDTGERLHGFTHPQRSLDNARKYFDLTLREEDIIRKHMFPLTISLPKYRETYVIVLTDKVCGAYEVMKNWVGR